MNASFISNLKATYLPGKTIIAAKGPEENKPAGCDVIIRFSDVRIDYNEYHLFLSIHFIDPKSGTEIGVIPVRPYYGNDWGLRGYLNETLKEIGVKLNVEVNGATVEQKKGLMDHFHKDKDKDKDKN